MTGSRIRAGRLSPFLAAALVLFRLLVAIHAPADVGVQPADSGGHALSSSHDHAHAGEAAGDDSGSRGSLASGGEHGCHFCRATDLLVPEPASIPVRKLVPDRGPARLAEVDLPVPERHFLTRLRARAPPFSA